jgi:hypothetical protein
MRDKRYEKFLPKWEKLIHGTPHRKLKLALRSLFVTANCLDWRNSDRWRNDHRWSAFYGKFSLKN